MNVVILNGGPGDARGAVCQSIAESVADESRRRGWSVTVFDLDQMAIKPCRGCFACWLKHPGTCAIQDGQESVLRATAAADLQVWITPVAFGGYGPALKRSLDRLIPSILPFFIRVGGEVHHPQRYERRRRFLALGTLPAPDAEAERIFHGLVRRNALNFGNASAGSAVLEERTAKAAMDGRIKEMFESLEEQG